ncbi:hypothetical protein GCM10027091_38600 [Streptomyces daliensis]
MGRRRPLRVLCTWSDSSPAPNSYSPTLKSPPQTGGHTYAADDAEQSKGAAGFLLEMGMLKRAKRSGWWIAGVKDTETIAEHSFRVGLIGSVLAMMEGADPARSALLGLWHDTQETRVSASAGRGRSAHDLCGVAADVPALSLGLPPRLRRVPPSPALITTPDQRHGDRLFPRSMLVVALYGVRPTSRKALKRGRSASQGVCVAHCR